MADVIIRIITKDEASEGAQQAATGFKKFEEGVLKAAKTVKDMSAVVAIAAVALKGIYDQVKQGAVLELTEQRFEKLAVSIGTTADALLKKLAPATGGMLSNAEQMSLASQLIDLGLAKNEEMVVRLARVIAERGLDMQQVILTFANDSKMRLDALGLSVTDVEERTKKFQDTGMAYTDAFDLAVLEALEDKITLVGSATDTSLGSLERAEAVFNNLVDVAKMALVPVLARAADAFVLLVTQAEKLDNLLTAHHEAVLVTSNTYQEYHDEIVRVETAAGRLAFTQEELDRLLAEGVITATDAAHATIIMSEATYDAARAAEELTYDDQQMAIAAEDAARATEELTQALEETGEETETAAERMDRLNSEAVELIANAQDAVPKLQELNDILNQDVGSPLTAFIEDIQFFIASGGRDFAAEFGTIQETLARKLAAEDTTPGQATLAMIEAKKQAAELLVDWDKVNIELGKETELGAAKALSETLGISVEDAKGLLTDFETKADEVFGEEYMVAVNDVSLEELHTKLSMAEEGAYSAEEAIIVMNDATVGAEEAANNLQPLSAGLNQVEGSANRAGSALARLIEMAQNADLSNLDVLSEHSPAPLAAGLESIAGVLPIVTFAFAELADAVPWTDTGMGNVEKWIDTLLEGLDAATSNVDEFTDALFDAADAFGSMGNAASKVLKDQLSGLKEIAKGQDEHRDSILEQIEALQEQGGNLFEIAALTNQLTQLDQERAEIAAQMQEKQEAITALQEKQQQLAFLQQQFEFLQFLQEHGLNAAQILGGVQLGLGADPIALADAMTNALTQVIEQLSSTIDEQFPNLGFQQGGIVAQTTAARVHAGEMVLTPSHQRNLFDFISGFRADMPGMMAAGAPVYQTVNFYGPVNFSDETERSNVLEQIGQQTISK